MLKPEITKMINDQINKELYSGYLYLNVADYYADEGLTGFENWFVVQAEEEEKHANILRKYLIDNEEKVVLAAIAAPNEKFANLKDPLTTSLAHEKFITASINAIYEAAAKEKDFRTTEMLNWFVKEQIEEEKNATNLIRDFERSDNGKVIFPLDHELGERKFVA